MSPFNDYCLVCERVCPADSVYCSETCKSCDQKQATSPTLSACSSLHSGQQQQRQQLQQQQQHNHQASISSIISPLLTPQLYSNATPMHLSTSVAKQSNSNNVYFKSPQFRDLSYDSPMLSSTSVHNDLDSNRLDLNASSSLYHQLHQQQQPKASQQHRANAHASQLQDIKNNSSNSTTTAQVSDLLSTCASENYKIWLSIH